MESGSHFKPTPLSVQGQRRGWPGVRVPCCRMHRRALLLGLTGLPLAAGAQGPGRGEAAAPRPEALPGLAFPRDFGAHPQSKIEWWYVTGEIHAQDRLWGFQVTFFQAATQVAANHPSRFAAHHILFAHAALTDVAARRLHHDGRIARSGFEVAQAAPGDTRIALRDWTFARNGAVANSRYVTQVSSEAGRFAFAFTFQADRAPLRQGVNGISQKGPDPSQTSHYYSIPQLAVSGRLTLADRQIAVRGRAWLDHEWSDGYLPPEAVGWDWTGMNLDDGSSLMAFQMRRKDGSALHAGGSFRGPDGRGRNFGPDEVRFEAGRRWTSPATKAEYPVEWTVHTPAGRFQVRTLLDAQELDSRNSTGTIYWEGLSDLLAASGRRLGRGYLEMTGYAGPRVL